MTYQNTQTPNNGKNTKPELETTGIDAAPLFSIVIPMYNVEKYIVDCLSSVFAQSCGDFEVICVDDGCTDGTIDKVKQYTDPRLRLIRQPNRGLSGARNSGIFESRGRYVALLDSDDYWHPEKLQQHRQHFLDNPGLDISYSASLFIDESGERLGIGQFPKTENITAPDIFCRNPIGNGSAAVIRRAVFDRLACVDNIRGQHRITYFDETMRQSEDIEFWLRAALEANCSFGGIASPLTYYRVNQGGLSASIDNQYRAWLYAVGKLREDHPEFFARWFNLADAYQKRYLARRAVQSGHAGQALSKIHLALAADWRIAIDEPLKTLVTYGCAMLRILPDRLYHPVEKSVMLLAARQLKDH